MKSPSEPVVSLDEGRFARLQAIDWWDQALLQRARVLVIGAGALGNEVIKNLALLGVGNVVIVDMDHVEESNLSRSVLFRQEHEGMAKAECAARAARGIYPEMNVIPLIGNVLADVGLGYFRWAQVVVGALDNREARVFVNSACARVGRPWIDGGIEVLDGVVRGFSPPETSCYECTMSQVDWDLLNKRRSCSLLARRAAAERGTPTTSTIASIIGAMQVQEVVKLLHGMDALLGRGLIYHGKTNESYPVDYPINPDCPWHEEPFQVIRIDEQSPLKKVWDTAFDHLGGIDALDLSREIVDFMECPSCKAALRVLQPADRLTEDLLLCSACGTECFPKFVHSVTPESDLMEFTACEMGLPPWDILWARRRDKCLGIEIGNPLTAGTGDGSDVTK